WAGCGFSVAVVIDLKRVPQRLKPSRFVVLFRRGLKPRPFKAALGLKPTDPAGLYAALKRRSSTFTRHYFASAATGLATCCFFFQSPMAARIASAASTEQGIFTGGGESSFTMSMCCMARASSTVFPLTHAGASEEEEMAEPQP